MANLQYEIKPLTIAVIGRTHMLLRAATRAAAEGHRIAFVASCEAAKHDQTSQEDFRRFASEHGAPYCSHRDLTKLETQALISDIACDTAISMNWLTLIPKEVRKRFRFGILNAHPGDLPRYRGNACPNWAILAGEPRIGLTIHQMADELDAGPVAARKYFEIDASTYISDIYGWLAEAVPEAFSFVLSEIARGSLIFEPQSRDPASVLRCYPRRPEDGRINWSLPANAIARLVRASGRPMEGAFSMLEGKQRVTIWRADPFLHAEPFLAVPGQIAFRAGVDPVIACGQGYLRLIDVALEGASGEDAKRLITASLRNRLI